MEIEPPRHLSTDEIDEILSVVPEVRGADTISAHVAHQGILANLREQLEAIRLAPAGIPELKDAIVSSFNRAVAQPGATVGILAAEALAAIITQLNLRTFKQAGTSRSSVGVGRMTEIVGATTHPKNPTSTIYFRERQTPTAILTSVRQALVETTVTDVLIDYEVDTTAILMSDGPPDWYDLFERVVGRIPQDQWLARLHLSSSTLYACNITMAEVATAIEQARDGSVVCVYSPLSLGLLDIYPVVEALEQAIAPAMAPYLDNAAVTFLSTVVIPSLDKITLQGISGIHGVFPLSRPVMSIVSDQRRQGDAWRLRLNRSTSYQTGITQAHLVRLLTAAGLTVEASGDEPYLTVRGSGDQSVVDFITQHMDNPVVADQADIVVAETTGTNLRRLFLHPLIDSEHTISDDFYEVLAILGVEAARAILILEINRVIGSTGSYADPRHSALIADFMTNRGTITPMTYTGIQRQPSGPVSKATFGQALKLYQRAGAFGSVEGVESTSTAITTGARGRFGTGYFDIELDRTMAFAPPPLPLSDTLTGVQQADDLLFNTGDIMTHQGQELSPDLLGMGNAQLSPFIAETPKKIAPPKINPTERVRTMINRPESRPAPSIPLTHSKPVVSNLLEQVGDQIKEAPCLPRPTRESTLRPLPRPRPRIGPPPTEPTIPNLPPIDLPPSP